MVRQLSVETNASGMQELQTADAVWVSQCEECRAGWSANAEPTDLVNVCKKEKGGVGGRALHMQWAAVARSRLELIARRATYR